MIEAEIDIYKEYRKLEVDLREKFKDRPDLEPVVKMVKAAYLTGAIHGLTLTDDHDPMDVMKAIIDEVFALHKEVV